MKFYSYGSIGLPVIMLIHGGGNSKWMFERAAKLMENEYRVIVPELDGHGEENAITYESANAEGDKIIEYIDKELGGRLFCIAGASLGSQIAMEVLSRRPYVAEYAFLESGISRPKKVMAKLMAQKWLLAFMEKMYRWKWLVRLQCKYSGWPQELAYKLVEDVMEVSVESNYNLYRTYFNYKLPESICRTNAKVLVIYGSKESKMIKQDAQYAASRIAGSSMAVFEGYGHCGCSLGNPKKYVDTLKQFLR